MCKYSIWVSRQIFYSSLDSFMISVISDTLLSVYFKVETVLQLLLLNSTPSNVWVKHSENTNKPLNPNESLNNTPTCFKGSNFLPSCTLGEPWNYYLLVSCRGSLNYKQDSCGNLSKAEWSAALRCSFYYWGSLLPAWRKISVEAPGWGQCVDNIFEVSVRTRKECGDSLNLVSCGWKCTELRGKSNWLFFCFFFITRLMNHVKKQSWHRSFLNWKLSAESSTEGRKFTSSFIRRMNNVIFLPKITHCDKDESLQEVIFSVF